MELDKKLIQRVNTIYTGAIQMGFKSQPMDVVFDTGSDWLVLDGQACESCTG
jgi:hypothetical protein